MRKLIFLSVLSIIYSCKSQNNKNFDDCDITSTNDVKGFEELYSNLDTTTLYKDVMLSFDKVKSGILLYQINHNNEFGNFVIIDNEGKTCNIQKKGINKKVNLSEEDKLLFINTIPSIKNFNYYQSCKNDNNNSITLFIIKSNDIVVSRFFTISNPFFESKNLQDENYRKIKDLFKTVYEYSFK
jgi:hypothetical protein